MDKLATPDSQVLPVQMVPQVKMAKMAPPARQVLQARQVLLVPQVCYCGMSLAMHVLACRAQKLLCNALIARLRHDTTCWHYYKLGTHPELTPRSHRTGRTGPTGASGQTGLKGKLCISIVPCTTMYMTCATKQAYAAVTVMRVFVMATTQDKVQVVIS